MDHASIVAEQQEISRLDASSVGVHIIDGLLQGTSCSIVLLCLKAAAAGRIHMEHEGTGSVFAAG